MPAGAEAAASLARAIEYARVALLAQQREDGHWCFELESDCTITAEYILMMHYMDEIDGLLQEKMACYLRAIQATDSHGGWSQYHGGAIDVSCTVKAYYALKACGDDPAFTTVPADVWTSFVPLVCATVLMKSNVQPATGVGSV